MKTQNNSCSLKKSIRKLFRFTLLVLFWKCFFIGLLLYSSFLNGGMTQVRIPGQPYKILLLSLTLAFYLCLAAITFEIKTVKWS